MIDDAILVPNDGDYHVRHGENMVMYSRAMHPRYISVSVPGARRVALASTRPLSPPVPVDSVKSDIEQVRQDEVDHVRFGRGWRWRIR